VVVVAHARAYAAVCTGAVRGVVVALGVGVGHTGWRKGWVLDQEEGADEKETGAVALEQALQALQVLQALQALQEWPMREEVKIDCSAG